MGSELFSNEDRNSLSALPQGWAWAKLDTVCNKIQDGMHFSPPVQYNQPSKGLYPYITAKNIKDSGIDLTTVTYIEEKYHQEIFKRCNPEYEDVLLTKDGVKTGEVCINQLKEEFSLLSSVALLKPKKEVLNPHFLKYYLSSPFGFSMIVGQMTGVAIKRIILEKIKKSPIILPPLCEQQRIAAKIEELFTQLDAGVASLKKVQAQLKRYRKAVLKAAFEGRLTQEWREEHIKKKNIADWSWTSVSDLGDVISGYAFKSQDFIDSSPIPVVKISNIGYGEFIWQNQEYLPDGFLKDYSKFIVQPSILLIALTRPITNNTLKICIYPQDAPLALLNQRVAMIKPREIINIYWMYYFFRTPLFKKQVEGVMSQTLQPNLSPLSLNDLQIPFCSKEEQNIIVSEIERHFSQIDHIENTITTSLRQAETLRQSILKRAFEGKLVPQDPNDEPASILIERIKAEKARHAAEPKKGKTLQPISPKRKIKNGN